MTPLLVLYLRILSSICPAKLCETAPGEIERDLFIGCNNELLVPKPQMALQPLRRPNLWYCYIIPPFPIPPKPFFPLELSSLLVIVFLFSCISSQVTRFLDCCSFVSYFTT